MGDTNPIRSLGDYSKPSHEGYKNTIELLVGEQRPVWGCDKIDEQLRIVIIDRNIKEENLKKELHSVKLQLASTINHNKSMVEEVTSLKKDFKQKENKYIEEFLDMKALKEKVKDKLYCDTPQNQRDLPKDIPLDSVVVLGTSHEVSVSAEGVEELKRKVKRKGEKKEALLTLRQKLEHQSDTQVITMKMEILLEPTSNKLIWLERFDTSAGNPIKEILLKLNLPDHRILKDRGEGRLLVGFQDEIKYEHLGPKTKDRKKVKYYKDDQVTMKDLKGKVNRQRQRQRKGQDQDHKCMIRTKRASINITRERLKIKTRSIKDQRSRSQREISMITP
ncbi:hypothetical protein Tco_0168112 [Tanacetum coccineum]